MAPLDRLPDLPLRASPNGSLLLPDFRPLAGAVPAASPPKTLLSSSGLVLAFFSIFASPFVAWGKARRNQTEGPIIARGNDKQMADLLFDGVSFVDLGYELDVHAPF